jgi:hypothetical protein
MDNWKVQIIDRPGMFGKDLHIFRTDHTGEMFHLYSKGEEQVGKGGYADASLHLTEEMLQGLADQLLSMGIKPQQGFVEGKLEATEKHLEDMRTLVFKK